MLILNGAHQGTAGFGLATDPNLNAVLFDSTQPQGQRFSILNNTIVARMYHSEATLLPDGRVLISGSDPQDTRYPEEFRIEVIIQLCNSSSPLKYSPGLHTSLPHTGLSPASVHSSEQRLGLQWSIPDNQREAFPRNNHCHAHFADRRSV